VLDLLEVSPQRNKGMENHAEFDVMTEHLREIDAQIPLFPGHYSPLNFLVKLVADLVLV
jgi:hypothetical protein